MADLKLSSSAARLIKIIRAVAKTKTGEGWQLNVVLNHRLKQSLPVKINLLVE